MIYPDVSVVKLGQKNHFLSGKCEVCTALTPAGTAVSDAGN